MAFQLRFINRDTVSVEASFSQSITNASNIDVNPEPGSAQGTDTVTTPCSSHFTLGTSAILPTRFGEEPFLISSMFPIWSSGSFS